MRSKKLIAAFVFVFGMHCGVAMAQSGGGFQGPGPGASSVEQAKNMRDDSHVALQGSICFRMIQAASLWK